MYAIVQKLVSRPVEFCLPLCHATNGDFSYDAREKSCRQSAEAVTNRWSLATEFLIATKVN